MTTTPKVKIHGKEYEVVASRVQRFREEHPDYAITTEIFQDDRTPDLIMFKASILNENGRVLATGHAEETRGSTQINRTSALENCETSAIGRALACYGYIGTEFASADEVANAIGQQADPEFHQAYLPKQASKDKKASEKQIGKINVVTAKLKAKHPGIYEQSKTQFKTLYGSKKLEDLTSFEASEFIKYLEHLEGQDA